MQPDVQNQVQCPNCRSTNVTSRVKLINPRTVKAPLNANFFGALVGVVSFAILWIVMRLLLPEPGGNMAIIGIIAQIPAYITVAGISIAALSASRRLMLDRYNFMDQSMIYTCLSCRERWEATQSQKASEIGERLKGIYMPDSDDETSAQLKQ